MHPKDRNHKKPLAGLRPDELLPGESVEIAGGGRNAAGTPGGGLASGGLAGTNAGDGSYDDDIQLEDAMGAGIHDHSGDRLDEDQPEGKRHTRLAIKSISRQI